MPNGETGESGQWTRRMNKVSAFLSSIAIGTVTGNTIATVGNHIHTDVAIAVDASMLVLLGVAVAVDELFPRESAIVTTVASSEATRQQG